MNFAGNYLNVSKYFQIANATVNVTGGTIYTGRGTADDANPRCGAITVAQWDDNNATLNISGGNVYSYGAGTNSDGIDYWMGLVIASGANSVGEVTVSDWGRYDNANDTKIASGSSSQGTLTVKDNGYFWNWTMDVASSGQGFVNAANNATLHVNGTITAGMGGTGTVNVSDSATFEVVKFFVLGSAGTGNLNVTGGTVTMGNDLQLATGEGSTATATISGGGVSSTWDTLVGRGVDSTASLTVSGTANVDVGRTLVLAWDTGSTGTLNLNGGTFKCNYIDAGSGTATINFNGGTLVKDVNGDTYSPRTELVAREGEFIAQGSAIVVGANGGTIDTNGRDITIASAVTGSGKLTLTGGGTVRFSSSCACKIILDGTTKAYDSSNNEIKDAFTWKGASGANWSDGSNWWGGSAPGASDIAIFDANASVTVSGSYSVYGIVLADNTTVTFTGSGDTHYLSNIYIFGIKTAVGDKVVLNNMSVDGPSISGYNSHDWYVDIDIAGTETCHINCRCADGSNGPQLNIRGNLTGTGALELSHSGHSAARGGVALYGDNAGFYGICTIKAGYSTRCPPTFFSPSSGSANARWIYNDSAVLNNAAEAGTVHPNTEVFASGQKIEFGTYEGSSYILGFDNPIADGIIIELGGANINFECALSARCRTNADRGHKDVTIRKVGTKTMTLGNDLGKTYVRYWDIANGTLCFANSTIADKCDVGGPSGGNSQNATFSFTGGAIAFDSVYCVDSSGAILDVSPYINSCTKPIIVDAALGQKITWGTALVDTKWTSDDSTVKGLTKKGEGTLTLNAFPTYTGITTITAGELDVAVGGTYSSDVVVSGGTFTPAAGSVFNGAVTVSSGTFDASAGATFGGDVSMTGGAIKIACGASIPSLALTEAGALNVDLASAAVADGTALFMVASVADGATVNYLNQPEGFGSSKIQVVEQGGKTVYVYGVRTLTWSGASPTDATAWSESANWGDAGVPSAVDNISFPAADPSFVLTKDVAVNDLTAANGLTLNLACDLTVKGDLNVTGALVKNGPGKLIVKGTIANTLTAVTINGGTIEGALPSSATLTLDSAALSSDTYTSTFGAKVVLGSAGTITDLSGDGTIIADATQTYSSSLDKTFVGTIGGTGGFTKAGSGTLTLVGSNFYEGDFTISSGTLKLGSITDISDVRYNMDASAPNAFSSDAEGKITAWNSTVGTINFGYNYGSYIITNYTTLINERRAAYFCPDYVDNKSASYKLSENNASRRTDTIFFVYNLDSDSADYGALWGEFNNEKKGIFHRNPNRHNYWFYNYAGNNGTDGFYYNGEYKNAVDGAYQKQVVQVLTSVETSDVRTGNYTEQIASCGSENVKNGIKGLVGQVTAFTRVLSCEERTAAEAYLMDRWGVGTAGYHVIPESAAVSIANAATLDLNGLSQKVASLTAASGSTLKMTSESTLTVTDAASVDGLTLTLTDMPTSGEKYTLLTAASITGDVTLGVTGDWVVQIVDNDNNTQSLVLCAAVSKDTPHELAATNEEDATSEATNYAILLSDDDINQGLKTTYYKGEAFLDGSTWYVRAVLDETKVAPALDTSVEKPVEVTTTSVTIKVNEGSLNEGLYYGLKMVDGNGNVSRKTKVLYDGLNADDVQAALTAALPESGVLYYTIEASDTATVSE